MALFAAEFRALAFGGGGDLAPDVAAEQIAHPFALAQPVDHRVEAALQLTEFGPVEDHQIAASGRPRSTRLSAARTTRTGVAVSQARIHIRMKPNTSVAADDDQHARPRTGSG